MEIQHCPTGHYIGQVKYCVRWWELGVGLLFRRSGRALLKLPRTTSGWRATIMTYGMRFSLDLVFLDADGIVQEVAYAIPPGRHYTPNTTVAFVLEGEAELIDTYSIAIGDQLSW